MAPEDGGEHRGGDAFAHHIGDGEENATAAGADHIIEITANLICAAGVCSDLEAVRLGQHAR